MYYSDTNPPRHVVRIVREYAETLCRKHGHVSSTASYVYGTETKIIENRKHESRFLGRGRWRTIHRASFRVMINWKALALKELGELYV